MSIMQSVWSLDEKKPLDLDSLLNEKELEDLLCDHMEILNRNWMVIGRQVQTSSNKFIDILCMDHDGDIVIVELKKGLTPREVTAQAILIMQPALISCSWRILLRFTCVSRMEVKLWALLIRKSSGMNWMKKM